MKRNNLMDKFEQLELEVVNLLKTNTSNVQNITKLKAELHDLKKDFALDLISIVEAFELKIDNLNQLENEGKVSDDERKIIKSFHSILRKLYRLLEKNDIKEIEFEENIIKVGLCKIIDTKPDPTKKDGTILYTLKKGFYLGDKVLCEAEVVTVKN